MSTYGRKEDCPPVERFIWSCIGFDYSDFVGIKELSFSDLLTLRSLIDHQATDLFNKSEDA